MYRELAWLTCVLLMMAVKKSRRPRFRTVQFEGLPTGMGQSPSSSRTDTEILNLIRVLAVSQTEMFS